MFHYISPPVHPIRHSILSTLYQSDLSVLLCPCTPCLFGGRIGPLLRELLGCLLTCRISVGLCSMGRGLFLFFFYPPSQMMSLLFFNNQTDLSISVGYQRALNSNGTMQFMRTGSMNRLIHSGFI